MLGKWVRQWTAFKVKNLNERVITKDTGSPIPRRVAHPHRATKRRKHASRAIPALLPSNFEAWLKPKIQENPLIETHFGWKLESLVESTAGVEATVVDQTGQLHKIKSQYVIGCDGAGSKVRAAIGSKLEGGPVSDHAPILATILC